MKLITMLLKTVTKRNKKYNTIKIKEATATFSVRIINYQDTYFIHEFVGDKAGQDKAYLKCHNSIQDHNTLRLSR